MSEPSATTTVLFVLLVTLMVAVFIVGTGPGARSQGESTEATRRWSLLAAAIAALWLIPSAGLARAGALREFDTMPPPLFLLMGSLTLVTGALAASPLGRRLASGLGWVSLIGFQAFRVPLEGLLYRLHLDGVIPVQMTFAGLNLDVLSGVSAAGIAIWAAHREPPRWLLLSWNLLGLALLINIVTIAVLSAPVPFRQFHNEPSNLLPVQFPFVWLPAYLVQIAFLGHLLVFRRLLGSSDRSTT